MKIFFGCRMMAMAQQNTPNAEDTLVRNELLYNNPLSLKNQSAPCIKYRDGVIGAYDSEDLFKLYYQGGNADGWGIVSYNQSYKGQPYIMKSALPAYRDPNYYQAVTNLNYFNPSVILAHVRMASDGANINENTHPFTYKNWSFQHNGSIPGALQAKSSGEKPKGKTDTEHAFYYFLGNLQKQYSTTDTNQIGIENVKKTFASSLVELIRQSPEVHRPLDGTVVGLKGKLDLSPACNIIASDGENIFAFKKGHKLYYGRYINSQGEPMYIVTAEKTNLTNTPRQIEWVDIPEEHVLTISKNMEGKYEPKLEPITELVPSYDKIFER